MSSEPPTARASRWPWWSSWVASLAVLAVVVVLLRGGGGSSTEPEGQGESTIVLDVGGGEPAGLVARVQGQVYVEIPRPEPEPVVEVVIDPSGEVEARWKGEAEPEPEGEDDGEGEPSAVEPEGEDDGEGEPLAVEPEGEDEGEGEPSAVESTGEDEEDEPSAVDPDDPDDLAPPSEPPPVDLAPPPEGGCTVIPWQQGTRVGEPTPCRPDGTFEVTLHPGRHGRTAFEVLVPGHLRAVLEVDVPDGGVGRLPPVALGQGERGDGQVVDGRGEPLSGIVVEAMPSPNLGEPEPWRATSDAAGNFAFETLPPGPVSLRAQAPGHAMSVVEAIAPQSDLLVTLQALVDLKGRVVGAADVLARAHVRIEGSGIWPVRELAVEPDGRFVVPQVPDGIYALEALVIGGPGQVELASIPLENVTPDLSLTLALVPAFRVPVEVRAPGGAPV
ncbi:MAG: carboxypeptidase regulatory-like domain-containing protein, partial [Myxococcales bacterium]|nr:carboxypeptidase regulatory-like domain-containing protein [Myxococcales bacterium]